MTLLHDARDICLSCDGVRLAAACRLRQADIRETAGAASARLALHGAGADALLPGRLLQLSVSGHLLFEGRVLTLSMTRSQDGDEFVAVCEGVRAAVAVPAKCDVPSGPDLLEYQVELSASGLSGRLRCRGMLAVQPGDEISMAGLPMAFARSLPVTGVLHQMIDEDWTTCLDLGEAPAQIPDEIHLRDSHGNRLALDASGIRLDSPAGIVLNGLSIDCHAQAAFTARGAATAELSASGQTSIKGALVMIN